MPKTIESVRAARKLLLAVPIATLALTGAASAQCVHCSNEDPKQILLGLIDQTDSP